MIFGHALNNVVFLNYMVKLASNMSGSEDIVAQVSDMAHGPLVTFKVYFIAIIYF